MTISTCGPLCALLVLLAAPSAAAGAPVPATPSPASPPSAPAQAPAHARFTLGDAEVIALSDGITQQPMAANLVGVSARDVQALTGAPVDRIVPTAINAYLIRLDRRRILVDAGAGDFFGPRGGGLLLHSLAEAGVRPEDIDAVLITHMHGDHAGGLLDNGARAFPNATLHLARAEYDFWREPANAEKTPATWRAWFQRANATLAAYADAGRVRPFGPDDELFPGLRAQPAFGHTPGHTFYRLERGGAPLLFVGDIAHLWEVQFARPQVGVIFDLEGGRAAAVRAATLARAAGAPELLAGSHLPFPGVGQVRGGPTGYVWTPRSSR